MFIAVYFSSTTLILIMKTKTILLTLFLCTGLTFQNCSDSDPDCECCFGPVPDYFDIQDMVVNQYNTDNEVLDGESIRFLDYGSLNLYFEVEYIGYQAPTNWNFSLMNSAYGCSPPEAGTLGSKEEAFSDFQIITLNDFDEDHLAGSTINDLLTITNLYGEDPILLSDFLTAPPGNVPQHYFMLELAQQPSLIQDFQVSISVELSTGESYEVTSTIVTFD